MTFVRKVPAISMAIILAGAISVFAQDAFTPPTTPEEAIAMREAAMKENGGLLRGAGNLTGADAVAAAQTLLDNYTHLPDMFPEGSAAGSDALPTIWENWEAFTAIIETGRAGAETALTAAQAGDMAGYAAGLQTVQGTCGQCHQQFRS